MCIGLCFLLDGFEFATASKDCMFPRGKHALKPVLLLREPIFPLSHRTPLLIENGNVASRKEIPA